MWTTTTVLVLVPYCLCLLFCGGNDTLLFTGTNNALNCFWHRATLLKPLWIIAIRSGRLKSCSTMTSLPILPLPLITGKSSSSRRRESVIVVVIVVRTRRRMGTRRRRNKVAITSRSKRSLRCVRRVGAFCFGLLSGTVLLAPFQATSSQAFSACVLYEPSMGECGGC